MQHKQTQSNYIATRKHKEEQKSTKRKQRVFRLETVKKKKKDSCFVVRGSFKQQQGRSCATVN